MNSFLTRAPGLFGKGRIASQAALLVAQGRDRGCRLATEADQSPWCVLRRPGHLSRRQVQRLLKGYT